MFTDDRARSVFPDWEQVADERAYDLWLASAEEAKLLVVELAAVAGPAFTERADSHEVPRGGPQRWRHPAAGELRFEREVLELPAADAQELVVFLPADEATGDALVKVAPSGHRHAARRQLRLISATLARSRRVAAVRPAPRATILAAGREKFLGVGRTKTGAHAS